MQDRGRLDDRHRVQHPSDPCARGTDPVQVVTTIGRGELGQHKTGEHTDPCSESGDEFIDLLGAAHPDEQHRHPLVAKGQVVQHRCEIAHREFHVVVGDRVLEIDHHGRGSTSCLAEDQLGQTLPIRRDVQGCTEGHAEEFGGRIHIDSIR